MSNELKPPPHLSVSSIQTYQQCPLKFKYSKIDLIADEPNEASLMGNFVHDVLEYMYRLPPEARTIESAKNIARDLWDSAWGMKVHEYVPSPDAVRMFRWNSWWCIENLWKLENPEKVSPIGLEYEVNAAVGGVVIKGFIDRFSQSEDSMMLTVSDYKTGKTPRKEYQDDKFFQLSVYAKLLSVLGIGDADKVELLYLKDGVRLSRKITDSDLDQAVEIIQEVKACIDTDCQTGYFAPVTSVLCGWCSYKPICPKWKK